MPVEFGQSSIREWLLDTQERGTISDVVLNGCQGGTISELIYYADTNAFYEKYQEEIWQMLWDSYSDCGSDSILHFIETFNGADGVASDLHFRNLLAWWAAEEVCRQIMGDKESEECFDEISTALHQETAAE